MAIGTSTAAADEGRNRTPQGSADEVPAAGASRPSRLPLVRRLMSVFAFGLTISALAAAGFGIAGSDDGVFVSLLIAGGFLSLTATATLRYFSKGRL